MAPFFHILYQNSLYKRHGVCYDKENTYYGGLTMNTTEQIQQGKTVLGIEFGSTRIKAVLVDEENMPIASGSHDWENRYENNIWTYSLEDIWDGLQDCYRNLAADVERQYGVKLQRIGAIGFSAMMHGYMPFDEAGNLLVPFRTWRNNITGKLLRC